MNPQIKQGNGCLKISFFLILLGIFGIIIFPYFFDRSPPPRPRSEAQGYLSQMNIMQQVYQIEKDQFITTISELNEQLGIKTPTENYTYFIESNENMLIHYAIPKEESPIFENLKYMVGGVFITHINLEASSNKK
jgi:hypothetical protein